MKKVAAILLSVALTALMAPTIASAAGLNSMLSGDDNAKQDDAKAATAEAPAADAAAPAEAEAQAGAPAADDAAPAAEEEVDVLAKVVEALGNDVYTQTLQALQAGEVITSGTQSQAAAGLQQTLVDFGLDVTVDGDAGPLTFGALNQLLGIFKMGPVEAVDANLYGQLLPLLLISQKEDVADELLRGYYEGLEESNQYDYLRACTLLAKGHFYMAKEAFEESRWDDYDQRAAACVQPWPANGEMWHNPNLYYSDMSIMFDVNSYDESRGRYFEIFTDSGELAATLFLTGSGQVTVWLPGGIYRIKDCTGYEWYGMKDAFGPDGHYEYMTFWEFDDDKYRSAFDGGYDWVIGINSTESTGSGVGTDTIPWNERQQNQG